MSGCRIVIGVTAVFEDSLVALSQLLHLVGLGLRRSFHRGDELFLSAVDFLLFNGDLFFPLYHFDFDLFQADLLLLLRRLQLKGQLSLCFLKTSTSFRTLEQLLTCVQSSGCAVVPSCSLLD